MPQTKPSMAVFSALVGPRVAKVWFEVTQTAQAAMSMIWGQFIRGFRRSYNRRSNQSRMPSAAVPLAYRDGGGGAMTLRSPLCSGPVTMPAASIASIKRAARL